MTMAMPRGVMPKGAAGCVWGEETKREARKGTRRGGTKKEDIPWGISSLCAG